MKRLLFIILTAILAGSALSGQKTDSEPQPVVWETDFSRALQLAEKSRKPILLDVYADWCGYCRKLKKDVYPSKPVLEERRHFINVTINGEKHPAIMRKFEIRGFPALVFMDRNGYVLDKLQGLVPAPILVSKLADVRKRSDLEDRLLLSLKSRPRSVVENYKLAAYYSDTGRFVKARDFYLRAYLSSEKSRARLKKDALYNAALSSMELKQYAPAVKDWNTFIKKYSRTDTDHIYARYYRGLSLKRLGRKELAAQDLAYAGRKLPSPRERRNALKALAALPSDG